MVTTAPAVVEPPAAEPVTPPSTAVAAPTPVVAPPSPLFVGAVRAIGPVATTCDGLPRLEALGEELSCDADEPYERMRLASPAAPFDDVRVVFASAGLPSHEEMGALVLDVTSADAHHLFVLGVHDFDLVGYETSSSLEVEGLRIVRAGDAVRLVLELHTSSSDPLAAAAADIAVEDESDHGPWRSRSETHQLTCALESGTLACASILVASEGSRRAPGGGVLEAAEWRVTATLEAGDVIRLSDPIGTFPDDLEPLRPRTLVFDDLGRTPARTLSNHCHRLFSAGELDDAEAACTSGIAARPTDEERGALLYDRGRIAEARGDVTGAAADYTASLGARPGNAIVEARLAALRAAEPPGPR